MNSPPMKRLYIDVNHWISLAKSSKAADPTLETRLSFLVDNEQLVVPISCVHLMEIAAILNPRQRQELATMLKTLARGWVLRPLDEVMYLEVRDRLATHYGLASPHDITADAIVRGFVRALGEFRIDFSSWRSIDRQKAAAAEQEVWTMLNDESILDILLEEHIPKIGRDSDEHKVVSQAVEQTRAVIREKSLHNLESDCSMGMRRQFVQLVLRACNELSLTLDRLAEKPLTHFWASDYVATLPTFDVWSKLAMYMARATQRTEVNDLYDLGHLAVATPYCDIVVTDKAMAHLLTHRGLHKKYGTSVYSTLESCLREL